MSITTKNGDKGETYLFGGKRVLKSHIKIEILGSVDELSSFLSMIVLKIKNKEERDLLISIQKDLYQIMAVVAGARISTSFFDEKVKQFETKMKNLEVKLSPLNRFIIPGGSELSCWLHLARTVCRRVERVVVKTKKFPKVVKYLNRLSDLLFLMARSHAKKEIIL
ncbi:MAG: cob(I)yrinic acid a,c-diamide adenosyltransferase [Patescibacteria group bacterium]|nr:cob(I)yrinic acid a,c-diamide adenosyltransferase [Patescibacteria group bacterium]